MKTNNPYEVPIVTANEHNRELSGVQRGLRLYEKIALQAEHQKLIEEQKRKAILKDRMSKLNVEPLSDIRRNASHFE